MNKREFIRYNSIHLVYYSLFDADKKNCGEGVGRTINISEGGALIEINLLPEPGFSDVVLELAFHESIIKIQGRVVFTRSTDADKIEIGIQFIEITSELKKLLLDFFRMFTRENEKNKNLMREKTSNIGNVVLTLSKEHKIISNYVIECRNMLERKGHDCDVKDLVILFEFMDKDMVRHFRFEDEILFEAALTGEQNPDMAGLVETLKNDHSMIKQKIRDVRTLLESLVSKNEKLDQPTVEKIDRLMALVKSHARNEMVNLFPAIDSDRNKIRVLNRLLTGNKP